MAHLAADVPLHRPLAGDVVAHRVAAVAQGPGRAVRVVGLGIGIPGGPPVAGVGHVVPGPGLVHDVPLRRIRNIGVPALVEVALLPDRAVGEIHVLEAERDQLGVGLGEVAEHRFGMDLRITDDIGHLGGDPAVVLVLVAGGAGFGADVMGAVRRGLGHRRQRGDHRQMSHVGDQLPDLPVGHAPGRHGRVPDAVPHMVEDLAVRHRGQQGPQHGRARIGARADLGLPAAVIGVAGLALLLEQGVAGLDVRRARRHRIDGCLGRGRHAVMQEPGGDRDFRLRRVPARHG